MKKSSKLIVGLAAAALAFGSLVAIKGPKDMQYYHRGHHHDIHHHHDCDAAQQSNDEKS
ncbi:MAG: hypothetical protein ACJA08_002876 [Cyclobacteriaceae bacterium]|jgi:hypothetical protein